MHNVHFTNISLDLIEQSQTIFEYDFNLLLYERVIKFMRYFMSIVYWKIGSVATVQQGLIYTSSYRTINLHVCYTLYFRYSLGVSSPERFVRTRLYFTSESHIHSLLNMLRYGGLRDVRLYVGMFCCADLHID